MGGNNTGKSEKIQKELIDSLNLLKKKGRSIVDDPELITRLLDTTDRDNYFRLIVPSLLKNGHLQHRLSDDDSDDLMQDITVDVVYYDIMDHQDAVFPEDFLFKSSAKRFNEKVKSYRKALNSSPLDENMPSPDFYEDKGYDSTNPVALLSRYYIEDDNTIYNPKDHSPIYNKKHKDRITRKREYIREHLGKDDIKNIAHHPAVKVISAKGSSK